MTALLLLGWALFNADPVVADFHPWSTLFVALLICLWIDAA